MSRRHGRRHGRGRVSDYVRDAVRFGERLPRRPPLLAQMAPRPGQETEIDRLVAPAECSHPELSGFRLVSEGPEAFALRAHSADLAGRSLDVQTYIWHADLTGLYLAYRVLVAADRGVMVRLLVDDVDARAKNYIFAALDAHPNISVRMFNPFASREGFLREVLEIARSFSRLTHRMHNKTWIADNRIAVVGGRNLGDEYFGASEDVNFVDLDFAMLGPIVRDASSTFDRYWNSRVTYPIHVLAPAAVMPEALDGLRARLADHAHGARASRFAAELHDDNAVQRLVRGHAAMTWSGACRLVADDPLKATGTPRNAAGSEVLTVLLAAMQATRRRLEVLSPYFVPGRRGTRALIAAARAGKRVHILTNSLAANDVAAVHGGYSKRRAKLLRNGVHIWELKPSPGRDIKATFFGSTGASLHTKALTADGRQVFVGSYNIDPRSTKLNCEQGVLVEDEALAARLEALFARYTSGRRAWAVTLGAEGLQWSDGTETFRSDPLAPTARRLLARLARWLPIDAQL